MAVGKTRDPIEEAMLHAVYAAPDEDAPRLVYADWLQERGDPRGELIALQFARLRREPTRHALARERSLLKLHRRTWLGPVWDLVYRTPIHWPRRPHDLVWERGFLAEAVTNFRAGRLRAAHGDPRWSTVRSLMASDSLIQPDGTLWPQARAFYLHDVFRGLVELERAHPDVVLEILCDPRPRRLHTLGMAGELAETPLEERLRAALAQATGTPELRELKLAVDARQGFPGMFDWLWSAPLGTRLEALELQWTWSPDTTWRGRSAEDLAASPVVVAWTQHDAIPKNVETVCIVAGLTIIVLDRRAGDGWTMQTHTRH
jgi:uncharacterized protein (TIGR02996 family)